MGTRATLPLKGDPTAPLVVITDDRFGESRIERDILEAAGCRLEVASCASSSEVVKAGARADALLVNLAPVDAAAIEALERCRVISRYGVGLDNIDREAAARRGIAVRNIPGYCDAEVGEHSLGLILDLARGISRRDAALRARDRPRGAGAPPASIPPGRRLRGSVLGVVGFGGIARALIRAARGLGFEAILAWSPSLDQARVDAAFPEAGATLSPLRQATLKELLTMSDWISLHIPLTPTSRGIIGRAEFGMMKEGAVLINTARGAVVDEEALCEALASGRLAGAGLDVTAIEPLPASSPLLAFPNVLLTGHSAYASVESIADLRRRCALNALEVLRGA